MLFLCFKHKLSKNGQSFFSKKNGATFRNWGNPLSEDGVKKILIV